MTDMEMKTARFKVSQLRQKNIWKELELISVLITIIFVSSLLPNLLMRYVYTDPNIMETPAIFEVIPVFSFVLGAAMFIYVVVGNLMREMQAMKWERMMDGDMPMTPRPTTPARVSTPSASSTDLQAAMKSLSAKTDKKRTKVVAATRTTARSTKSKTAKRKNK